MRGNETDADGRLKMGRAGLVRRGHALVRPLPQGRRDRGPGADPPVAVQTSDGTWRAEDAWPPADAAPLTGALKAGSYRDDARNNGSLDGALTSTAGQGSWTFSPPLAAAAHLAGIPKVHVELGGILLPRVNLVADLYDVAPGGSATLISRAGRLVSSSGGYDLALYGQDWVFAAGHRVGVLITGANAEWWTHAPTLQTVAVKAGSVTLPWLPRDRATTPLDGGRAVRLDEYEAAAPFTVDAATIAANTAPGFPAP